MIFIYMPSLPLYEKNYRFLVYLDEYYATAIAIRVFLAPFLGVDYTAGVMFCCHIVIFIRGHEMFTR